MAQAESYNTQRRGSVAICGTECDAGRKQERAWSALLYA